MPIKNWKYFVMNKKMLVVADSRGWAFAKIYRNLKKHLSTWDVYDHYTGDTVVLPDHRKFDLIFYLNDFDLLPLINAKIPRQKVIIAIRSHVKNRFYNSSQNLKKLTSGIAVANSSLYERFSKLHPLVMITPGGVDTELFKPSGKKSIDRPITVGWAGTEQNVSRKFRGLDLIQKSCDSIGYVFKPALREEKWRTEEEMVDYYQNDIDVYIDVSLSAGRQNGLLEAGACGKAVISNRVGIAEYLIKHGKNGMLVDREISSITDALKDIKPSMESMGENIRKEIEKNWSWNSHVKYFEMLFNKVLRR